MHGPHVSIIDSMKLSTVAESRKNLKCHDIYTSTFMKVCH